MTGLWFHHLHAEPEVPTRQPVSTGAEFFVLEIASVEGKEWTRVRLADGREGWLEGAPRETALEEGRISHFSYEDTRVFFTVNVGGIRKRGFLLGKVSYYDGYLDKIAFRDATSVCLM